MATPNNSPNSAASKTSTTAAVTVLNSGLTNGPLSFNSAAFPMKLTPTNYLSWKAQFTSLLAGYELDGYLDGRHPCPVATAPEYSLWARQDQLLRHALITSVSENITPYIAAAATAQQAWETLAKLYANRSRTWVITLKERLQNMKCAGRSVSEYLRDLKTVADELGIVDRPLTDDDLTVYILNGLGPEFREIAASLRARDSSLSFDDLHDRLVAHEESLHREDNRVDLTPATAHFAAAPMAPRSGFGPPQFFSWRRGDSHQWWSVPVTASYLAMTRPDLSFAVNRLSQFMHQPTTVHWQAAKRVLRYLRGTCFHGLLLRPQPSLSLHAFSDADWAGDRSSFVSTTGYLVFLGSNPISWRAAKQKAVARSSTEAEYRALAATASEVIWISHLLSELGVSPPASPAIFCDNVGATYLSLNPVMHSRMKHIAIDLHFVRDLVDKRLLHVSHISSHDQLADGLTKSLSTARFSTLRSKIGVANGTSVLRGRIKDNNSQQIKS
ncbi:hypothetical protein SLEP1_g54984 [Rubroshorea leprosula]|uniref:Uncharacterized protein n=1 Tax=Rubroshorea leprosula TaxID=152421 RepID=A0AAV5ME26_9ROSI|nr:hypothetical protein SLEP1_g54984 [Rubroshorea leprosula]